MSIEYLKSKPSINYRLPIVSIDISLPLEQMPWEDFEKLCLRMVEFVERFDMSDCEIFGRKGQKQDGIDIYALKDNGKYNSFQCKKYKSISSTDLNNIFSEFQDGEWYSKSEKFFICTSANFDESKASILNRAHEKLSKKRNKLVEELSSMIAKSKVASLFKSNPTAISSPACVKSGSTSV